ncbi:MAG: hypothetical protein ACSHX8_03810 [Opitutaceae bacterium]
MAEKAHKRIEEETLSVALNEDDFAKKVQEILNDEGSEDVAALLDQVVYYRGELPRASSIIRDRFWWAMGVVGILVFLYGLYSLFLKARELITL